MLFAYVAEDNIFITFFFKKKGMGDFNPHIAIFSKNIFHSHLGKADLLILFS